MATWDQKPTSYQTVYIYIQQKVPSRKESAGRLKTDEHKFDLWLKSLPAMAERCRDWEHNSRCKDRGETSDSSLRANPILCSCGFGKVGRELNEDDRKGLSRHITPVAIALIFPSIYLDLARRQPFMDNIMKMKKKIYGVQGKSKLKYDACDKEVSGERKCGDCEDTWYCSRGW